MSRSELLSDLDILDYLELFSSTVRTASALGISQSSCSRRYRQVSEELNLEFERYEDSYRANANHDVLADLRQAAQKVRIRKKMPRYSLGWQAGPASLNGALAEGEELQIRPMDTWKLISMLSSRLIDLAVVGLRELQAMLPEPLELLRCRRIRLDQDMMCVPICLWELRLVAHRDHPLAREDGLSADDLCQYPSPSLPLGAAPLLMKELKAQGLANSPYGFSEYDFDRWEGAAANGVTLSYCATPWLERLRAKDVDVLSHELGISECLGIVGHVDVIGDSHFPQLFSRLIASLQKTYCDSSVKWLN